MTVEEDTSGGVETAEGDAGGRWSKGFGRSRPFGSALGVKSAGVEGQNLSILSQCLKREEGMCVVANSGRRCGSRREQGVGRCLRCGGRGGSWGGRNERLLSKPKPFSPLSASPPCDEISKGFGVLSTTADALPPSPAISLRFLGLWDVAWVPPRPACWRTESRPFRSPKLGGHWLLRNQLRLGRRQQHWRRARQGSATYTRPATLTTPIFSTVPH